MAKREKQPVEQTKRPDVPIKNGHYMGLTCGFEYEDGNYRIAQVIYKTMDDLLEKESGIRALMQMHDDYFTGQLQRIASDKMAWWKRVEEEYGLQGKQLSYYVGGYIKPAEKEEPQSFPCMFCGLRQTSGQEAIEHRLACEKDPFAVALRKLLSGPAETEKGK